MIKLRDEQDRARARSSARLHVGPEHPRTRRPRRSASDGRPLRRSEGRPHQDARHANNMTPDVYAALIDQAHKRGLRADGAHLLPQGSRNGAGTRRRCHCAQRPRRRRHAGFHRSDEEAERGLHPDAHARSVARSCTRRRPRSSRIRSSCAACRCSGNRSSC